MKYIITANYPDAKVTTETNDVEIIFCELKRHENCPDVCVMDGTTGEVLMHNGSEFYATTEFSMMWLGWLTYMEHQLEQESEPEPVEADPIAQFFQHLAAMTGAEGGSPLMISDGEPQGLTEQELLEIFNNP